MLGFSFQPYGPLAGSLQSLNKLDDKYLPLVKQSLYVRGYAKCIILFHLILRKTLWLLLSSYKQGI